MDRALVTAAALADLPAALALAASARATGGTAMVEIVVADLDPVAAPPTLPDGCTLITSSELFEQRQPDYAAASKLVPVLAAGEWNALAVAVALLDAVERHGRVLYVAPSVECVASPDRLFDQVAEGLTLFERPLQSPDDGRHPTDLERAGAPPFTSSVLGAERRGRDALRFWAGLALEAASRRREPIDVARLLPALARRFAVQLRSTEIGHVDGYSIDPPVIATVDTVGHNPRLAHRLDATIPPPARVRAVSFPAISSALARRARSLLRAEFALDFELSPGLPFDEIMRAAYRDALEEPGRADPPHPLHERERFVDWLRGSDFAGPHRVSRYLRRVYLHRPDLSRTFPAVPGPDTERFHEWARSHGTAEIPIPAALLPSPPDPPVIRAKDRTPTGVNVVGWSTQALGIGETPRRVGAMLAHLGVPHRDVPIRPDRATDATEHPINVIVVNPDSLLNLVHNDRNRTLDSRYNVGIWAWETTELPPAYSFAFDLVDEVWGATDYVVAAVRARAPAGFPVKKYELPIYAPTLDERFDPAAVGLDPARPYFLCSLDYLSVADRKNPFGVIAAFRSAFDDGAGPQLAVKSLNHLQRLDDHDRVAEAARGRRDIVLIDRELPGPANAALLARAACVISLHRSEGYAYNLADALALGRPVIATGYSGNLDFMQDMDESLVDYTLTPVGPEHHPYPSDAIWADPDLDDAAAKMRSVIDDPAGWNERAASTREVVLRRHSLAAAAGRLRVLLDTLGPEAEPDRPKRRWRR